MSKLLIKDLQENSTIENIDMASQFKILGGSECKQENCVTSRTYNMKGELIEVRTECY